MEPVQESASWSRKQACEEELLRIAREELSGEASLLFLKPRSYEVIYHYSDQRQNAVSWLPIRAEDTVLEIGAGCGVLTEALSFMAGQVVSVEASEKLSQAASLRLQGAENVILQNGPWQQLKEEWKEKSFDWILLPEETELDSPAQAALLKSYLAPGGHLVLFLTNPYGLSFFAGVREPESGRYFESIEGYPSGAKAAAYPLSVWKNALEQAGFGEMACYYPFPDHRFPNRIFSDSYLPTRGELHNESCSLKYDRLRLFDEQKAWDKLVEAGLFPQFANSWILMAEDSWKE